MIKSIQVTGVKYTPDERTRKYILRKIGRLDRFLPRHARKSVSAEIKLREINGSNGNKYEAEVLLRVPDKHLSAKDSTLNVMAAIDIVEAKLANQLRKYKENHVGHIGKTRAVLAKLKRSYARDSA
ncbi:ribosome-associated translation inhibitor RaiA [Candidatus Nomurabacteria bacterium]|nr:ribosome-associated translation inhibitor RaiA [Candidatus Nomurabacteria bacterium]